MTIINTTNASVAKPSAAIFGNSSTESSTKFSSLELSLNSEAEDSNTEAMELATIYGLTQTENSLTTDNTESMYLNSVASQVGMNVAAGNAHKNSNHEYPIQPAGQSQQSNFATANTSANGTPVYAAQNVVTSSNAISGNQPLQSATEMNSAVTVPASLSSQNTEFNAPISLKKSQAGELSSIKAQTTAPNLNALSFQRPNTQLALQTQLQVQSVVAELSNIDSTAANAMSSPAGLHLKTSQWGPVPVNTSVALPHQAQQLMTPLREQVRFQIDHQVKQAEIRLDPPELGKLDMNVKLDGERLQVHLHAATAQVRDALQAGIERLRSDLALDHGGQVDVNISYGEQESKQQPNDEFQIIAAVDARQSEQEQESTSELDVRA